MANIDRLLRDAKLLDARLKHIDGAGNTGTYLIQLVEGKAVAQSEPPVGKSEDKSESAAAAQGEAGAKASESAS